MKRTLLFLLLSSATLWGAAQQHLQKDAFIRQLLAQMTLDEKIGQLNLPDAHDFTTGIGEKSDLATAIRQGNCGALFNLNGKDRLRELQRIAVEESRLGIPLFFGLDAIHGFQTIFPIPLAQACTWDMEAIRRGARITAEECSSCGINWTFSPMVDIAHDPRWGRVAEGAGEDPYLGSAIARAMISGYQQNLSGTSDIMACVKHFALYGAAEAGRDYNTVDMSRTRMYNEFFPPYKAAVEAGAASIMTSFNTIDYVPATGNRWLQTDVLRGQWHFGGFVVTDYNSMHEMGGHGMGTAYDNAVLAANAGVDLDMADGDYVKYLHRAIDEGRVDIATVDQACYRILAAKYDLGLFDDPYRYFHRDEEYYRDDYRQHARKMAAESFVLLKNDTVRSAKAKPVLPLDKKGTIAVIGPMANTSHELYGMWTVAADRKKYRATTVVDAIREAVGGRAKLLYAQGSNFHGDAEIESHGIGLRGNDFVRDIRNPSEMVAEAVNIAEQSDVVIAVVGESSEMTGECASRSNLELPQVQRELLAALKATGRPVVMVHFSGRPTVMTWENEHMDAILNVWFGGSEASTAIADVLFGDVAPSGHLTMSFPRNVGQLPYQYNHLNTGRALNGDKFGKYASCYLDVPNSPLFPFGYGLSYTTFTYGDVTLSRSTMRSDETVMASVTVSNSGDCDADEVVQLYIRDVFASISRPVKELKGFQRIHLKAGEARQVTFEIDRSALTFYDEEGRKHLESGEFFIMAGPDSEHLSTAKLTLQ